MIFALVAEQVDAADLKSVGSNPVPVRFRPSAPFILLVNKTLRLRAKTEKLGSLIFFILQKQTHTKKLLSNLITLA